MIGFCIQAGQAIAFDCLLAEAAGAILEEGAPLIHSLLSGIAKNLPGEIPEKKEIRRMKRVNSRRGWGATDGSWNLLPYLFATCMTSNIWNTTAFNVDTGGFNNNIHCLASPNPILSVMVG
ncbi:hypothetical protein M9H77_17394 [Catharanthus roseus]|uniref:Uncharacterized protein n=1 Tax=Catharanthus roseus TaxID=4058 RepID=A0ACC0B4H4_CATRO|nr:hypothetical protein M9H77_17394 [Catharanthus roseus]